MIPGEYLLGDGEIVANADRRTVELVVANTGDRPIQVGSHFHFFEVNRALRFDRALAFGMRLDVPAGTAVRFEPGDEKRVRLVEVAGARRLLGLNGLTDGRLARGGSRAAGGVGSGFRVSLRLGPAGSTPISTARRPATGSAWPTPTSSSESSGTSPCPARRPSSAAARCCGTAWGSRPAPRGPTGPSTP